MYDMAFRFEIKWQTEVFRSVTRTARDVKMHVKYKLTRATN